MASAANPGGARPGSRRTGRRASLPSPPLALEQRTLVGLILLLVALAASCFAAPAGSGAPMDPRCAEFSAQADAQAAFAELGGSPARPLGNLDGDRDGIACEGLPGPYAGYATLGYNRRGGFLFGVVSMPVAPSGEERYPCLRGNPKGPNGPRRLNVYRVGPDGDRAILDRVVGAEARPESGHLLWKAPRAAIAPGRYYVGFAESIPLTPYGRSKCPAFRSAATTLPRPRQAAAS